MKRELGRMGLLSVSLGVGGVFAYAYQVLMIRFLGNDFGVFSALVGVFNVSAVFASGLAPFASREVVHMHGSLAKERAFFDIFIVRLSLWLMAIAVVIGVVGSWKIGTYIHTEHLLLVSMALANIWLAPMTFLLDGMLRGMGRYGTIAWGQIFLHALKHFFGLPLIALGAGIWGAFGGFVLAGAAVLGYFWWVVYARLRRSVPDRAFVREVAQDLKRYGHDLAENIAVSVAIALCVQADVILAAMAFPPETASLYAAASSVAKFLIFFGIAVEAVSHPRIMAYAKGYIPWGQFLLPLGVLLAGGAGTIGLAFLGGEWFLSAMRSGLGTYNDIFILLALMLTCLSIASVYAKLSVGWKHYTAVKFLWVGVFGMLGYAVWQVLGGYSSPTMLATTLLAGSSVIAIYATMVAMWQVYQHNRQASSAILTQIQ